MKNLAIIFVAFLACSQTNAATSALTNSLLEYEAITNFIGAPNFNTIGPNEFIVDIKRLTRRVDILGTVEYEICTQEVRANAKDNNNDGAFHNYLATLLVEPNPAIGPRQVTVISIVECDDRRAE